MINEPKINKNIFEIDDLHTEKSSLNYWLSKSPQERINAIEMLRRINYGEYESTRRLQRFFEVAELKSD